MWVRPTSRGWMVLASAFTAFLIAMVNASLGVSMLAAGCLALAGSSYLLAWFALRHVDVRREPSADGYMGHAVALPLTVCNRSRWHRQSMVVVEPCAFAPDGAVTAVVMPLKPLEEFYLRRSVVARQRGVYQLTAITLRGGDPAGLFVREHTFPAPRQVTIYPEITTVATMPLSLRDRVIASSLGQPIGVSGQGQDFYGVREYRPMDGIRFIHWKASAKFNKLMVREFEENTVNQVTVFLDVNEAYASPNGRENFEYLIRVAASISSHLSSMYFMHLFSCGRRVDGKQLRGPAQSLRGDIMRVLAELRTQKLSLVDQIDECIELIAPNSIVYCLSLHEEDGLEKSFNMLLQKNIDIRWIHAPRSLYIGSSGPVTEEAINRFASRRSGLVPQIAGPTTSIARLLSDE